MSNHNEISSFIWNVCDDVLRGLFKQHEYGDVILPFLVLRRLDCVIEPKKELNSDWNNSLDKLKEKLKKIWLWLVSWFSPRWNLEVSYNKEWGDSDDKQYIVKKFYIKKPNYLKRQLTLAS